jgi:hypothetical protein
MDVLDEYMNELTIDTSLDEFSMRDVQMKLPAIKHKWAGRLIRTKIQIAALQKKRQGIIDSAIKQLIEQSPIKLSIPLARQRVESLDSVTEISSEISHTKLIVEFLEKIERILSSMTFDIKNLTEIMKLETQ